MTNFGIIESTDWSQEPVKGFILPFPRAHPVQISQGYGGPHGHFARRLGKMTLDDTFSIDFALPFKTPVIAAKKGIVTVVYDSLPKDSSYTGLDVETGMRYVPNLIVLSHEDKTYTLYAHLAQGSASVSMGESVNAGQRIARTGPSGWVGDIPNLHFAAFDYLNTPHRFTFPIDFLNYDGELEHSKLRQ